MNSLSRTLSTATLVTGLTVGTILGASPAQALTNPTHLAPAAVAPLAPIPAAVSVKTRITVQPANASIRGTQKAKFKVKAVGTKLKYQWYSRPSTKKSYAKISGATKASYTTPAQANKKAKVYYRVTVTGKRGKVTSRTAAMVVKPYATTTITAQPANASVRGNSTATFRVKATGEALRYQWDVKAPGKNTFASIKGATKSSYTTPRQANKAATSWYRVRVSGKGGSKTSRTATLVVKPVTAITSQPTDASIRAHATATFSVKATGASLKYQWDVKAPGKSGFTAISGATKASYTTPKQPNTTATSHYRVRVSGAGGSITSRSAVLKVTAWAKPTLSTTKAVRAESSSAAKIEIKGAHFSDATITVGAQSGRTPTLKLSGRSNTSLTFTSSSKNYSALETVTIKNAAGSTSADVLVLAKTSGATHTRNVTWVEDMNNTARYGAWSNEVWFEANFAAAMVKGNSARWSLIDNTAIDLLNNAIRFQTAAPNSPAKQESLKQVRKLYGELWVLQTW